MGNNYPNRGVRGGGRPVREYFWEGVLIPPGAPIDQCWTWNRKSKTWFGYGIFKRKYAHRFAYELERGPIGPGLLVCHKCDNPSCVNPNHLFLGTQSDNMRDCKLKHRHRVVNSKLSAQQVREIRELAAGGMSYTMLEARFHVNRCSLHDAVHRKTYQWVT